MNSVVEKLAAIENEVAAIQPKMAPLTERIADLDQKVAGFAQQLSGIADESAAVKQDIELTRQSLTRIQTLIGESRVESEQLVAGQEENQQRCETMTAVFGAAFQAFSQFFEAAQRLGLADHAKAGFSVPAITPLEPTPLTAYEQTETAHAHSVADTAPVEPPKPVSHKRFVLRKKHRLATEGSSGTVHHPHAPNVEFVPPIPEPPAVEFAHAIPEPVAEIIPAEPPIPEPVAEIIPAEPPMPESVAEIIPAEPPMPESVAEIIPAEPPMPVEPVSEETSEAPPEETGGLMPPALVPESPVEESPMESVLSESDFDSVVPNLDENEFALWGSVPGLPDVAAMPEMDAVHLDPGVASFADVELSSEIASQLDVPPLNLAIPTLPVPVQAESAETDDTNDQEIEDLLATMMTPITT